MPKSKVIKTTSERLNKIDSDLTSLRNKIEELQKQEQNLMSERDSLESKDFELNQDAQAIADLLNNKSDSDIKDVLKRVVNILKETNNPSKTVVRSINTTASILLNEDQKTVKKTKTTKQSSELEVESIVGITKESLTEAFVDVDDKTVVEDNTVPDRELYDRAENLNFREVSIPDFFGNGQVLQTYSPPVENSESDNIFDKQFEVVDKVNSDINIDQEQQKEAFEDNVNDSDDELPPYNGSLEEVPTTTYETLSDYDCNLEPGSLVSLHTNPRSVYQLEEKIKSINVYKSSGETQTSVFYKTICLYNPSQPDDQGLSVNLYEDEIYSLDYSRGKVYEYKDRYVSIVGDLEETGLGLGIKARFVDLQNKPTIESAFYIMIEDFALLEEVQSF
jgi:hypothetical protein